MFKAVVTNKDSNGYRSVVSELDESQLPAGDVLVEVEYSSLNYKDALAITGKGPIIRAFPMIPGIDFAGTVSQSDSDAFKVGDKVLLTGWGVGEKHWGGLAQKARVSSQWLVKVPAAATTEQVMAIGTAGFTAMLCVEALEKQGVTPASGPVLVTGAGGGVGSFAVSILSRLGYEVTASTGRPEHSTYLMEKLGASAVIDRSELNQPGKPLQKQRWAAAIDTVGSHTLFNACASVFYGGTVAACGMAQGLDLVGSVAPFILRNVTLAGVDSVTYPQEKRQAVWNRLVELVPPSVLAAISSTHGMDEAISLAEQLSQGQIRGRVVIACNQ